MERPRSTWQDAFASARRNYFLQFSGVLFLEGKVAMISLEQGGKNSLQVWRKRLQFSLKVRYCLLFAECARRCEICRSPKKFESVQQTSPNPTCFYCLF